MQFFVKKMASLAFCLVSASLVLSSCGNAEYDAFHFGPDPVGDDAEAPKSIEKVD